MAMSESDHPRSALEEDFLQSKSSRTNERTPDPQERLSDERESAQGHSNLFQCSICDQYLKSKNTLRNHINNVHQNQRLFRRHICDKSFKDR